MLNTSILNTSDLTNAHRDAMFRLYEANYRGANFEIFQDDLNDKDYVLILSDVDDTIVGFSTLAVDNETFNGKRLRVIFSGDTIIERSYWGQNPLAKAWVEFAGYTKAAQPNVPLYWLLIVKGHRTYRYLPVFIREYYPRHDRPIPTEQSQLMEYLGSKRFGSSYDPETGLVLFPEPRSYLNPDLAVIPEKDINRPEIKYFLERNPRYYEGDELLCLCELSAENFGNVARQWFEDGYSQRQRKAPQYLQSA